MTDLLADDAHQAPTGAPLSGPAANHTGVVLGWLTELYGHATDGWLTTFSIDRTTGQRRTDWAPVTHLDQLAANIATTAATAATADIWCGCATRTAQLDGGRRGGEHDCHQIPGLWLDIDIAGPNHKTTERLPTTVEEAHQLIDLFPLPPTTVVHSGGGLQAWWLFAEMLDAADAAPLLRRWGATWAGHADTTGIHIDNVFDLPRIMRIPGTRNHKQTAPVPVRVLHTTATRYGIDDLEIHLDEEPVAPTTPRTDLLGGPRLPYIGPDRPSDAFNAAVDGSHVLETLGFHSPKTKRDGTTDYVRPGKTLREGPGATVYPDGHVAIWSDTCLQTWPNLETRQGYTPFQLYALTTHRGDFRAAARDLGQRGYGTPHQPDDLSWVDTAALPTPDGPPAMFDTDGNEVTPEPDAPSRLVPGGSFILDAPDEVPAIWGQDDHVLWAAGESIVIVGPAGVGKTTITGQIVKALIGLDSEVLGKTVAPTDRRVLYLASDRPSQISRAFARLYTEDDRQTLDDKLRVWKGPPPADIATDTDVLLRLATEAEASVVILDSLKDMAIGLSDDAVGAGVNRAIQTLLAAGIDVLALHHQRKATADAKPPKDLASVYGSTWITAGAGSVVLIWGEPGDAIVELRHLKQPAAEVGPLKVEHDQLTGTSTVFRGFNLLPFLRGRKNGVTALEVARAQYEKQAPNDNEQRKARRDLDKLVKSGLARKETAAVGGAGGSTGARFHAIDSADRLVTPVDNQSEGGVSEHRRSPDFSDETAGQSTDHRPAESWVAWGTGKAPAAPDTEHETAGQSTSHPTGHTGTQEHQPIRPPFKGAEERSPNQEIDHHEEDPYAELF